MGAIMEKVSVIVPVYNVEKYIDRALESICGQTYQNIEVLLIDDGSNDRSGSICDSWREKDARVRVFHQRNSGVSMARNLGLDNADGDYVMFVDADDWIDTEMIEKLYYILKKYDADISTCRYIEAREKDYGSGKNSLKTQEKIKECVTFAEGREDAGIRMLLPWAVYCKLYKKEVIGKIRLKSYKIAEDLLFNTDIICISGVNRVASTNLQLYHYFIRENSAIRQEYQKKYLDGVLVEEQCYDRLMQISPKYGDINIVGCSVSMFFDKMAELPFKERRKYKEDYKICKKSAKKYKNALCKVSDRHRKISGMLKVYVPDVYLWTLIVRKRRKMK